MARLVFDIETSALPLETFDAAQQEYLLRDAAKLPEGPERDRKHEEVLRLFNLWPLTARVVCIAMLNAESGRGQVLFTADDYEEDAGTLFNALGVFEWVALNNYEPQVGPPFLRTTTRTFLVEVARDLIPDTL